MALIDYIDANFPQIKAQLGWSDSVDIQSIIDKTLELYGVATEGLATDTVKLHALADLAVWRRALNDISLDYAFAADNAQYSRNQAVEQVRKSLQAAESAATAYLAAYKMIVHRDSANPDWEPDAVT